MAFFHFSQNNSGGRFTERPSEGLVHHVIIEASSASEANAIAQAKGIYFNGVDDGFDCDCCGDRWSPAFGSGDTVPKIYGEKVFEWQAESDRKERSPFNRKWMKDAEGYIHYKDGRIVGFWTTDRTAIENGGKW